MLYGEVYFVYVKLDSQVKCKQSNPLHRVESYFEFFFKIPSSFLTGVLGNLNDKIGWFWLFILGCGFSVLSKNKKIKFKLKIKCFVTETDKTLCFFYIFIITNNVKQRLDIRNYI